MQRHTCRRYRQQRWLDVCAPALLAVVADGRHDPRHADGPLPDPDRLSPLTSTAGIESSVLARCGHNHASSEHEPVRG
jgi:hypothetical protein